MYSQGHEEAFISAYFGLDRQLPMKGVYVEIGAYDGITNSNTRALQLAGWSGVCIEANPTAFPSLLMNRADDNTACYDVACVANEDTKQVSFIEFEHLPQFSGLAPASYKVEADARALRLPVSPRVHIVQAMTLNNVLTSFFAGVTGTIDFISLDTEGTELDVLEGLNFDLWQPRLLCIENNDPRNAGLTPFMETRGYRVATVLGINTFYERIG